MPGGDPLLVASAYLVAGNRDGEENLGLLSRIGAKMAGRTCPLVLGMDAQMSPEDLQATGFADELGLVIASDSGVATCKVGASLSSIDFFLVEASLSAGIDDMMVDMSANFLPHRPVQLVWKSRLVDITVKTFCTRGCRRQCRSALGLALAAGHRCWKGFAMPLVLPREGLRERPGRSCPRPTCHGLGSLRKSCSRRQGHPSPPAGADTRRRWRSAS